MGDEYTYVGDDKLHRHNPLHDMTMMTITDMYKPEMNSSNYDGNNTHAAHVIRAASGFGSATVPRFLGTTTAVGEGRDCRNTLGAHVLLPTASNDDLWQILDTQSLFQTANKLFRNSWCVRRSWCGQIPVDSVTILSRSELNLRHGHRKMSRLEDLTNFETLKKTIVGQQTCACCSELFRFVPHASCGTKFQVVPFLEHFSKHYFLPIS